MFFNVLLMVLSFASLITCTEIEYTNCGDAKITDVRTDFCDKSPCRVVKEKTFTFELDFVPTVDAENVNFQLSTYVFGFPINIPNDDNDACKNNYIKCPIVKDEKNTFKYQGFLESHVPSGSNTIGLSLVSDDKTIVCLQTDLDIVDLHDEL